MYSLFEPATDLVWNYNWQLINFHFPYLQIVYFTDYTDWKKPKMYWLTAIQFSSIDENFI